MLGEYCVKEMNSNESKKEEEAGLIYQEFQFYSLHCFSFP